MSDVEKSNYWVDHTSCFVKEDAKMKIKLSLSVVIALWFSLFVLSPALAEKNYLAERFDVTIAVHPDGTMDINETIVFRFTGGPFTYVFRELAFNLASAWNSFAGYLRNITAGVSR